MPKHSPSKVYNRRFYYSSHWGGLLFGVFMFFCFCALGQVESEGVEPHIKGDPDPFFLIVEITHVESDAAMWRQIKIQDSIQKVEEGIITWHMRGPYLITAKVHQVISTEENPIEMGEVTFRRWYHMLPDSLVSPEQFGIAVNVPDSLGVYKPLEEFPAFKNWKGQWAQPTCFGWYKKFIEPKKAFFPYSVLKENKATYYYILSEQLNDYMGELKIYYGLKPDSNVLE
ncbi:MAG: hypothetical protein SchgKO_19110 [Schleiferiaceae bacterium]